MFSLDGFPELKAVYWKDIKPGMVFAGGVKINDIEPAELRDYPILSSSLLETIKSRYQFLEKKAVLVFAPQKNSLSARELSDSLRASEKKIILLNQFRGETLSQKKDLGLYSESVFNSKATDPSTLILDKMNSGIAPMKSGTLRPSLLSDLDTAFTIADLLTGRLSHKFILPRDVPFQLHLVVDFSYSMKASGKESFVQPALGLFFNYLSKLLPNADFRLYGFSDICLPLNFPLSGSEVPRKETNYDSFVKKVLHFRDKGLTNCVLLFTDGLPDNYAEAENYLARFRKLQIDFTQIVFCLEGDQRNFVYYDGKGSLDGYLTDTPGDLKSFSESEYRDHINSVKNKFTALAQAAGGNQIILNIDQALGIVAVETFDRWLGLLSMN